MTIALIHPLLGVREADLRNAREAARIDAFVHDRADGTPFHLVGWSRAVERGCGQRSRYLVAECGDGHLAGVLPLTEMRSLFFGRALVSSGFAVGGGVLGDGGDALAASAAALAERLGCGVELRGGELPASWVVDDTTYLAFARPLAATDEAELAAVPRKQRAEVRRALANDLIVKTGRSPGDVAAHHAVYAESVRNLGTPVFPPALMRAAIDELDADVLTVGHAGQAVASVLSLYHRGTVYPYWGGGTATARALRANDRMYFALMSHARARGCTRFDFGRSKTSTGAAAFKKNWGFVPEPLRYARYGAGEARRVNPQDERYRLGVRAWQQLPLPIANRLGPWLARGLG